MELLLESHEIPDDLLEFFEPVIPGRMSNEWLLSPEPTAEAHFATFPTELVRRCLLAGTSERGCCPQCGKAWGRVVERCATNHKSSNYTLDAARGVLSGGVGKNFPDVTRTEIGWQPSCQCNAGEPIPCTVLDPFMGSGTVGLVAKKYGRRAVGIELNPDYIEIARRRLSQGCLDMLP